VVEMEAEKLTGTRHELSRLSWTYLPWLDKAQSESRGSFQVQLWEGGLCRQQSLNIRHFPRSAVQQNNGT
jgi:hypothetical protein